MDVKYWKQLTDVQLAKAKAQVHEFKEIVTGLPGNTDLVLHEVKLMSDQPIRCKPYAIPYKIRESLDLKVYIRYVGNGSHPGIQVSVCFPRCDCEKEGRKQLVLYRLQEMNKIAVRDPEPMPSMTDLMQRLSQDELKYLQGST